MLAIKIHMTRRCKHNGGATGLDSAIIFGAVVLILPIHTSRLSMAPLVLLMQLTSGPRTAMTPSLGHPVQQTIRIAGTICIDLEPNLQCCAGFGWYRRQLL